MFDSTKPAQNRPGNDRNPNHRGGRRDNRAPQEPSEFEEKIIQISRVSKKTKGGNKMGFSILVVVGDKKGKVGVGLGKAGDVLSAIRKGVKKAKKKMIEVPMAGTTIPFAVTVKRGAGVVMLKPAPRGSGVIAGGPIRAVVEAAGIRDISSKIMGSDNKASSVYATFQALIHIKKIVQIRDIKLKSIAEIEVAEEQKMKELQEKAQKSAEASKEKKSTEKKAAKPVKPVAKKAEAKKPVAEKAVKAAKPAAAEAKTEEVKA